MGGNTNNYNPFTTAIHRKTLSVPMRILEEKGLLNGKIIDYGCGHGSDYRLLLEKGYNIVAYDKYNELYKTDSLLEDKYDIVVCNYVFNVIPKDEHKELLELLKTLGKEIYISVRSDVKAIKPSWVYCEEKDVYITTSNTYQRFYTELMIKDYFGEVKFIVSNNSLRLFRLIV